MRAWTSLVVVTSLALAAPPCAVAAQVRIPSGQSPCATGLAGADAVATWLQQILSDSVFTDARAQYSLRRLLPAEPARVWIASVQDCGALTQGALREIDDLYGTDSRWEAFEYMTIAIGPYLAVYDLGWFGDARPIVIFNASDRSFAALIHSSF